MVEDWMKLCLNLRIVKKKSEIKVYRIIEWCSFWSNFYPSLIDLCKHEVLIEFLHLLLSMVDNLNNSHLLKSNDKGSTTPSMS